MHEALALEDIWTHLIPFIDFKDLLNVVLVNHLLFDLAIDGLWGERQLLSHFLTILGVQPPQTGEISSQGGPSTFLFVISHSY